MLSAQLEMIWFFAIMNAAREKFLRECWTMRCRSAKIQMMPLQLRHNTEEKLRPHEKQRGKQQDLDNAHEGRLPVIDMGDERCCTGDGARQEGTACLMPSVGRHGVHPEHRDEKKDDEKWKCELLSHGHTILFPRQNATIPIVALSPCTRYIDCRISFPNILLPCG